MSEIHARRTSLRRSYDGIGEKTVRIAVRGIGPGTDAGDRAFHVRSLDVTYHRRVVADGVVPDAAPVEPKWIENRPTEGRRALDLRELWTFRELVWFLASRDVRVRYKQAVLGLVWAILQPLAGAVVLTFVFHRLADVPSGQVSYQAFVFCGLSAWTYFSSALGAATGSLVSNASLVTKVYFPRLAAPLSTLLPGLIDLGVALTSLTVILVATGDAPGPALLSLPFWTLAMMVVTLGPGLLLATLNVRYRDAHHAFGFLTQLWFFASPVAYPSTLVKGWWRYVYALNPMGTIIDGFRWAMLRGHAPGLTALVSAATTLILLVSGLRYFASAERRFSDII
jgi:homopolymeric O-antigen transport system permease protein